MQTLPAPYRPLVGRPVEPIHPSHLFAPIVDAEWEEIEKPSTPISDQVLVTILMGLCWSLPLATLVFLWLK